MRTARSRGVFAGGIADPTNREVVPPHTGGNYDHPIDHFPVVQHPCVTSLADAFIRVDRNTTWQLTDTVKLAFPTFHTQGIAITPDRIFLSAVEILEPTVKCSSAVPYDRSPGEGIGHLFVMDVAGNLHRDIVLGHGDMYHPGGIDFDGTSVWVPVAEYRPDSRSMIYRVDATTLRVHQQFEVADHCGAIVLDKQTGHLIGNTWGSRRFAEWDQHGKQVRTWTNPSFFIDYQDCQYVPDSKMLCAGVIGLPQTASAGGSSSTYELGGIAMIDLKSHSILHDVPFQQWSRAGHVATRNPFTMATKGNRLTVRVAPDNGDEANGTEILTYEATVTATPATGGGSRRDHHRNTVTGLPALRPPSRGGVGRQHARRHAAP